MKKNNIILFAVLMGVFWTIWLNGPHVATDYHYWYPEELETLFSVPYLCRNVLGADGMGQSVLSTMWTWPSILFYSLLSKLGFNFQAISLVVFVSMLLVGVCGISRLLSKLKIGDSGVFVGSLFYLTTTYFLLLIDGGQVFIALSYAIFPLAFVFLVESLREFNLKNSLKLVIVSLLLSIFDLRILMLFIGISFLYSFYLFFTKQNKFNLLRNVFFLAIVNLVTLTGFHFYWIYPVLRSGINTASTEFTGVLSGDFSSFTSYKHALLLLQPHWYENVYGKISPIKYDFLIFPLLAFSAPFLMLVKKSKEKTNKLKITLFWIGLALIGIFMSKGTNPPFGQVFNWLITNISLFAIFRDPTKFFFLIALSYSVLIGFSVDELSKIIRWRVEIGRWKIAFIPLFISVYLLFLIAPVYTGKMTGLFARPAYQKEHEKIVNIFRSDENFGRVLWIPNSTPLAYSSPTHPQALGYLISEKRPFAIGRVGRYEVYNFLREAEYMGDILNIAGIKYVAYPYPDTRREELKLDNIDYYYAFLDQFSSSDWIDGLVSEPPVAVLEAKRSQDHFFIAPRTIFVVGSDRIYEELVKIPDFELANNPLVFVDEYPGMGRLLDQYPDSSILIYDKHNQDWTMSYFGSEVMSFPASILDNDPNESGWWKRETSNFVWFRDFLQTKYGLDYQDFDYGGGYAIAEGNRELKIDDTRLFLGKELVVRVMQSDKGGKISFYQGEELVGEANTFDFNPHIQLRTLTGYGEVEDKVFEYTSADFHWDPVGQLVSNEPLIIKTEGDINVINAIAIVPKVELDEISWKVYEMSRGGRMYWYSGDLELDYPKLNLSDEDTVKISYESITPTHYRVRVDGIKDSATLAFSESYDPLWQLAEVGSKDWIGAYPLYSLINGFYVDHDGEYDIYFSPQKYVLPGLAISGITLIILVGLTIFSYHKLPKKV